MPVSDGPRNIQNLKRTHSCWSHYSESIPQAGQESYSPLRRRRSTHYLDINDRISAEYILHLFPILTGNPLDANDQDKRNWVSAKRHTQHCDTDCERRFVSSANLLAL